MRRDSPFALDSRGLLRNRTARIDLKPQALTVCGPSLVRRSRTQYDRGDAAAENVDALNISFDWAQSDKNVLGETF